MREELKRKIESFLIPAANSALEQREYDPSPEAAMELLRESADKAWESLSEEERRDAFVDTMAKYTMTAIVHKLMGNDLRSAVSKDGI
jgi:hypothetical protein